MFTLSMIFLILKQNLNSLKTLHFTNYCSILNVIFYHINDFPQLQRSRAIRVFCDMICEIYNGVVHNTILVFQCIGCENKEKKYKIDT